MGLSEPCLGVVDMAESVIPLTPLEKREPLWWWVPCAPRWCLLTECLISLFLLRKTFSTPSVAMMSGSNW